MSDILRKCQTDAIEELKKGSILCGGVGTGKSRTSLGYYFKHCGGDVYNIGGSKMDKPIDLYIITTAKKRDSLEWQGELSLYLLSPDIDESYYKVNVIIDSWNNIKKYSNVQQAFFIFDEQRLVGSGAWVKSFYKIANRNHWIILSATPGDVWSDYIPVFVANRFYRNKTEFLTRHAVFSRYSKFPKIDKYIDTDILERYRDDILVDIKLERSSVRITCNIMCDYDKALYKDIGKRRWDIFNDEPIINAAMLCFTWRKLINSHESRGYEVQKLASVNNKIIVFYNFNYELDILKSLDFGDAVVAEWNGKKHDDIPLSDKWVYLVQYTAGSEGWNCIETDTIVFYSQNYSYRIMEQAMGRIDRLNTPFEKLYYYTLISTAPIDLGIKRAILRKKTFNNRRYVEKLGG